MKRIYGRGAKTYVKAARLLILAALCCPQLITAQSVGGPAQGEIVLSPAQGAIPIDYGGYASGYLSLGEVDAYTFEGDQGDIVIISMSTTYNYGGAQIDPRIRLYGPDGGLVGSASPTGTYGTIAELTAGPLDASGTYTILTSDEGGNEQGDCGVSLNCVNKLASGSSKILCGYSAERYLSLGEVRAYQFQAGSGTVAIISMSTQYNYGGLQIDPRIRLYGPDGSLVGSASPTGTHGTIAELTAGPLDASGTYTILASDMDGNESDSSGLSLACIVCTPYIYRPDGPIDVSVCYFGSQACVSLPINCAGTVSAGPTGAAWDDGTLCFTALQEGEYTFDIAVSDDYGVDSAEIVVSVIHDAPVEIDHDQLIFIERETGGGVVGSTLVSIDSPCEAGVIDWNLTVIDGGDWLSVDKTSGTNPDQVWVTATDNGLESGAYSALLVFSDNSPSGGVLHTISVILFIDPGVAVGNERVLPGSSIKLPIILYTDVALQGFTIPLEFNTTQPDLVRIDSIEIDPDVEGLDVIVDPSKPHGFVLSLVPVQPPPVPESSLVTCYAYASIADEALYEKFAVDTATLTYNSELYDYHFIDESGVSFSPTFTAGSVTILGPNPDPDIEEAYSYPNPFNPEHDPTVLRYELSGAGHVTIKIYDVGGNLVRTVLDNEPQAAGIHEEITWDGCNGGGDMVANGVYFLIVESSDGGRAVGKIAVLR